MIKLDPVKVKCSWPVYKATTDDGKVLFVKVATPESIKATSQFLAAVRDCEFLPKIVSLDIPELSGKDYICTEWIDVKHVNAEDMTDAQADSLIDGYLQFSDAISDVEGVVERREKESVEFFHAQLVQYGKRHPIVARFIRPLIEIPENQRSYSGCRLVCIHGDFHSLNYGFSGDEFSAVFDTESVVLALACEDISYAFTERLRRSCLGARKRRRLYELFMRCMQRSPWPKEEWLIAINRSRLRIAAHRVAKHPNSALTAIDIAHRDKYLRKLQIMVSRSNLA